MKTTTLKTLLVCFTAPFIYAQAPDIEWEKNYGGSYFDIPYSMQSTSDGGYLVTGFTTSNDGDVTNNQGGHDFWIIKVSSSGNLEWQKAIGGTGIDRAYDGIETSDGGYLIVGGTKSNDHHASNNPYSTIYDSYLIVKLDNFGDIEWEKVYGGNDTDIPYAVIESASGGFVVAGTSFSEDGNINNPLGNQDIWIIFIDNNGNLQSTSQLGGSGPDLAQSIKQTPDGGYIVAGTTGSWNGDVSNQMGQGDFWVVKIAPNGGLVWEETYGGSNNDQAYDIILTNDGGYVVAGYTYSCDIDVSECYGERDMWVIKIDGDGLMQWETTIGGSKNDFARSVEQTLDGGFIVVGHTNSTDGDIQMNQGNYDYFVAKLDDQGSLKWTKTLGGSNYDYAWEIKESTDGGYIVAGQTSSYDGDITNFSGGDDFWLVKLYPENLSVEEIVRLNISLHPNPAQDQITINNTSNNPINQVEIYNLLGAKITTMTVESQNASIDVSKLNTGTYFLKIYADGGVVTKKIIKL